ATGECDHSGGSATDGCLTGEPSEPRPRRVALPAAPSAARAGRTVGVDDHVPELARETVLATLERTAGDDPAADAGAERHQHQVARATARPGQPLGRRRARGVVVDPDHTAESFAEEPGDVEVGHTVEVRGRAEHAGPGDQ